MQLRIFGVRIRLLGAQSCGRALASRDPRFDGVFFVGISTARIYCRPVCPARVAYPDHRRFFSSAAAAERDGFRPCLRCRPEVAPGRAFADAVPRVARAAALRIAAAALNGQGVVQLAREPLCYAQIGGLAVAMIVTLILVPVFYSGRASL